MRAPSPMPWVPSLVTIQAKPLHPAGGSPTFVVVTTFRTWFHTYETSEIIGRTCPYKKEACLNVTPLGHQPLSRSRTHPVRTMALHPP